MIDGQKPGVDSRDEEKDKNDMLFIEKMMYRVDQKSKLLILSEYVNKNEKIRGM